MNREQDRILKSLLNQRKAWQYKLLEWLCEKDKGLSKYMYVLTKLFDKQFTSKDLPFKSTQSCELIKSWRDQGLIMKAGYGKKTSEYKLAPTLFVKTIDSRKDLKLKDKQALISLLDEII